MLHLDESSIQPSSAQLSILPQADTNHTGRTHYTANPLERARRARRNSMHGQWHKPSFPSNESKMSNLHGSNSIDSSSTDKAISPPTDSRTIVPVVELPASLTTSPDEPHSFFDLDSESEGEPVLSRASTVRTQRPRLVKHNCTASGRSLRIYRGPYLPPTHSDPASSKAQQFRVPLVNVLHDLAPQAQRTNPDDSKPSLSMSKGQKLGIPLNNLVDMTQAVEGENPLQGPGGPAEALEALTANARDRASTIALAPTSSSKSILLCSPTSIMKMPNPLAKMEALSTPPSSTGGLTTLPVPHRHEILSATVSEHHADLSCQPQAFATNGLRSNLIRDSNISGLHRTISAPPLPSRRPHRQVSIRPLDLEAAGKHRLRQSVVSTPYPMETDRLAVHATSTVSASASVKIRKALAPTSEERGRFHSPARPELLYLELAIAKHHSMATLIQIKIEDRSSYDDESLFKAIRKSYGQALFGRARYLVAARVIRSATFTDSIFDAPSFLRHLASPKLGHKRKTWLTWLREHQAKHNVSSSNDGSENGVLFSTPISYPRMPFFKTHKTHPRVSFHFEFSLVRIALAVTGIMMISSLAVILWVLFGLPGSRPTQAPHNLAMHVETWHSDAQRRVLTGLVLGVLVALLGTMGGAGWIVASWLLL